MLDPKDEKGFKTESMCNLAIVESRVNKNVEPLLSFVKNNTDKRFWEAAYFNIIRHYSSAKDTGKIIDTYEEALKKIPGNTDVIMNYARFIFRNKIKDRYERGLKLVKKVHICALVGFTRE
jgi:Tfp pilus assembly protein PilF